MGRQWAAGLVVVAAVGAGGLVACSSDGDQHPPKSDVTISGCAKDPDGRRALVSGTVHNNSSKRSNYVVTVDVTANDSKIESGFASVLAVDAGERKAFTVRPLGADVPTGTKLTCKVSNVKRVAG